MSDLILLTISFLIGLPIGIVVGALLLTVSASLCNVESLGFRKACGIILLETVLTTPITVGGILLMGVLGYPLKEMKDFSPEQFLIACGLLGVLLAVLLVVSVIVFRLLIPVSLGKAARIWVLRFLINLLLTGLVGGVALVGLAIYQVASPK